MRSTNERRQKILEALNARREDTVANLMCEFDVSRRTLLYDLEILSADHPVITKRGRYGGVKLKDGYYISRRYLSEQQYDFLSTFKDRLSGEEKRIAESILRDFALPA